MKLSIEKNLLLKGLTNVSRAVSSKNTMSILDCILLNANNDQLILTGNNTELGIETTLDCEVSENGKIAINSNLLLDIVRKLPNGTININSDNNHITKITCENAKFNTVGKSADEFTFLPEIKRDDFIELPQIVLKDAILKTIFSVSDNDVNKIMTGELFEINSNILRIASLDGHRIAIRNISLNKMYDSKRVIVPAKTLIEVSKIISSNDDNIVIYFMDRHIVFEYDNTLIVSRLIDGKYFDIDQMLSNEYGIKLNINKNNLYSSIDRSSLLVKEGDKKPIIMNISDEVIEMKMNTVVGSFYEVIDIDKNGSDITIGFYPKFVLDALKAIDDDEIDIYMANPKLPCMIKKDDNSYIYIIMPVNIINVN